MAVSQVQAQEGGLAATQIGVNISVLLEAHLTEEPSESLFHGCVKQVLVSERSPRPELLQTLQFLFSAATQENMPAYVEQYVKFVAVQTNHQRVVRLLELLATLVASGSIKARLVCETILRCVDPSKETTWGEALKVIRRIVGGVDYKGCRDLIRCILDHFDRQPRAVPEQRLPALLKGKELLAYILDRNAALLPAYFAHDENNIALMGEPFHYYGPHPPESLLVMWRLLMDGSSVHLAFIKVAQRSQPKKLAAYMRKMVDYIVFTLPPDPTSQLNIVILHLRELVWKYKLFPVERLVLYMVLHGYEGRDAQNCLLLLHCLLVSSQELHQQTSSLVKEVPADYWSQPEWNQKHAAYLSQFPESFQPEAPGIGPPSKPPAMPMYFGNLSLRFLPVLDLVLQRLLEVPDTAAQSLETLLDLYGPLYKFHDHPIALLFSTLHYYEWTLAEHPGWKKRLVATIAGAKQAVHPLSWYFTAEFCEYLSSPEGDGWKPQRSYYFTLVDRLVRGLQPLNSSVPACDWRFSEFSGPLLCSLHCCVLELLALPLSGRVAAQELVQALYSKADSCREEELLSWVNALGLVFSSLPESFRSALSEEILQILGNQQLIANSLHSLPGNSRPGCLLSLMHAYWHHTNVGTLASLPHWLQTVVRPMLKHEEGLLYVCHLVGPLLQRLHTEKPRVLIDIVRQVYLLLQSVDKQLEGHMQHSDIICDFLYHIKYMHIGDHAKEDIDKVVSTLHMPLHVRLRFLVPTSTELPANPTPNQQPHRPLPAQSSSEPMQA